MPRRAARVDWLICRVKEVLPRYLEAKLRFREHFIHLTSIVIILLWLFISRWQLHQKLNVVQPNGWSYNGKSVKISTPLLNKHAVVRATISLGIGWPTHAG